MAEHTLLRLRPAPEWVTGPLWPSWSDEEFPGNEPPERLAGFGAGPDPVAAVAAWDDEYQAVYLPDDPASSEFPEGAHDPWAERGAELAARLAALLGVPVELRTRERPPELFRA
ncbi:hypothetical protein [Actinosynnema mirum]|uniref:Uncharacterized protein n=1 Tax=Actinosynnema mirum (strain ATCC 29888 / DSM 43827 / JCM 3225 / NBRC 14064 / NCIMB 13271 / NRRL B-12336 / IMRU 3971 / 101) TaxID=446462 RepID=C6WRY6_ACTMD|nr:hypothetical protein [Actinosynnema mirum]ACU38806.1 hypothetical protein Amir_4982 [Actinosynnema mirum DSM 43827]